ncbi:antibiotic biosynthesis monooxygenase [Thermoleophilia bacterium SCSIO 60948]|nr:antibiotic biosynthesis monooxygenase [Thermoleophilia bacterium SCSIO 60948]
MLIVAGHLVVDPADRAALLEASAGSVRLARKAPGCLDFATSADPVDPARVNVFERWESEASLKAFRESEVEGEDDFDFSLIGEFAVERFEVAESRS